ncbi:superoxide dismutase [Desulfospira joergensenii]|uniref:superoxide dismutase n=1 Tax=Desulfospira joergensenii TaxID=53329 RepID=UPI0003B78BE2|nr:superoxide dismutase [Desulfospira joergensenii]
MPHTLPELGYEYDALEPYIDAQTMEIHHTKHHQTYIDKLNAALEGHEELSALDVDALISDLGQVPEAIRTAVQNHGGGHSNHRFFWPLLKKDVALSGPVLEAMNRDFNGFEAFKKEFSTKAALVFGSGWAWLIADQGKLSITTTPNQNSPLSSGKTPVLGLDVWEHAYYLKYQNRRPDYIEAFFNVINWDRVNDHFKAAQ